MAAKKKAKRKAREWWLIEDPSGVRLAGNSYILGPMCDLIRVREILPRTPAKRKGGRR